MQLTILGFLREQLARVPPAPYEDLSGKTVIVLGANIGIGFEAAKHFALMKPGKLILACRDQKRADDALEKIKQDTGFHNMEVSLIDLKSFASVSAFADRFEKSGQRLDILVANAAILPTSLEVTSDGWESCFQVNNLSTSLLCLLLLPALSRTAQRYQSSPRIVVVASEVHFWSVLKPNVLSASNPLEIFGRGDHCTSEDIGTRYNDSKLFNILFVRALNERVKSHIIVNAVNPGLCASALTRSLGGIKRFFIDVIVGNILARSSEQGSRQLLWAALAGGREGNLDELRGAYVSSMRVCEPSDFVISDEGKTFQDKIWDDMLDELTKVDPKLKEIVSSHLKD